MRARTPKAGGSRVYLLALALAALAVPASSQVQTGRIVGNVRDAQDAVVPRANVTITSASTDLAEKHGVNLEGALTWAFEFEDQRYFAGFRALASNGIDLAVLNVFRMFGKMGGSRLAVRSPGEVALDAIVKDGVGGTPDVAALASLDGKKLSVMLWHYHDDDLPGPDADVELSLAGLPLAIGDARLVHYRIDEGNSNPYGAWKRMGSPLAPNADQYKELQAASQLAVSLVQLDW